MISCVASDLRVWEERHSLNVPLLHLSHGHCLRWPHGQMGKDGQSTVVGALAMEVPSLIGRRGDRDILEPTVGHGDTWGWDRVWSQSAGATAAPGCNSPGRLQFPLRAFACVLWVGVGRILSVTVRWFSTMLTFAFKYGYVPGKACTSRDACGSGYCKMKVLQKKKKRSIAWITLCSGLVKFCLEEDW